MRLVKRVLRPVYRLFFERPLWWFLARVKGFFLAEIGVQIEQTAQRVTAIEEQLRAAEASNAAQWDALEQLLLAMFRVPEVRTEPNWRSDTPQGELAASASGRDQSK